ncbi:MAG: Acetylspermidine deacetylase; Deacetylases, including yeast histone deacetylase and acetoin utilization protein, partial [uncultured Chloroflexia bacterium]
MPSSTGILFDERFLDHDDPGHPENARRLRAILALLGRTDILTELTAIEGRAASDGEIMAVHRRALMEQLQILAYEGGGSIDGDTYVTSDSWAVVTLAAGAVLRATEAVVQGEVANAFALVRPPGHHATPSRAMGFCLINHVAI